MINWILPFFIFVFSLDTFASPRVFSFGGLCVGAMALVSPTIAQDVAPVRTDSRIADDTLALTTFKEIHKEVLANISRYKAGNLDGGYSKETSEAYSEEISDAKQGLADFKAVIEERRLWNDMTLDEKLHWERRYEGHSANRGVQILFGMGGWTYVDRAHREYVGKMVERTLSDGRRLRVYALPLIAGYVGHNGPGNPVVAQIIVLGIRNPDGSKVVNIIEINLVNGESKSTVEILDAQNRVQATHKFPLAEQK